MRRGLRRRLSERNLDRSNRDAVLTAVINSGVAAGSSCNDGEISGKRGTRPERTQIPRMDCCGLAGVDVRLAGGFATAT